MFKKLKENAEKLSDITKETVGSVSGKVQETAVNASDKVQETAINVSDKIQETAINVSDNVQETATTASGKVEKTVSNALDMTGDYLDSNLEEIESYCSWCFQKHGCTPKIKNNFSRNVYTCNGENCRKDVVKCRACNNKAKFAGEENIDKDEIGIWSGNFCSVHEGTIANFETLNSPLSNIDEYRAIVERKDTDYKKIGTTAAYTIGGAAVIAPLALAAAPAVGGALGTSLLGYSGAAATNAGLATLGGGALAAGGAGMAGGVAVVTAAGSALGGRYGAVISNSYFGDIEGFDIIRVRKGKQPSIICIDGFLTEKDEDAPENWLSELADTYPENEIFYVKWESKRLRDLASTFVAKPAAKEVVRRSALKFAKSASIKAASKLAGLSPISLAFHTLGFATNSWSVTSVKAYQVGILLSDIIARTNKEYILIGHSLGARVIYSCLASLKTKEKTYIKDVHLLGGAIVNSCIPSKEISGGVNWSGIESTVSGSINNYYSSNDSILKYLYTPAEVVKLDLGNPIGRNEIDNPKINNVDVSLHVSGHSQYKVNMKYFLANISI